ncbi:hypothetical protein BSKO_07510 [Bryopsis sp. KO-2023]|nr:hypothetical protein BSKO_07510 [Bryopsis sp. KO-2023]
MWVLEPSGAGGEANSLTYLVKGPLSVGRPPKLTSMAAADVIVNGDSSVSKDHAQVQIATFHSTVDNPTRPEISVKDLSKFGTFINNVRVGKQPQQLNEGDIIGFGMKSKFRLKWVPLVLCLSPRARLAESAATKIRSCGISLHKKWVRNCTHVVVDPRSIDIDAVVACGLISECDIVSGKWIEAMLAKKVHVGCTPPASDFPTRLPLKTDVPKERMRVLEGIKFFWATSAEDPFSETLGQLAGATFMDPNSLSLGSTDDLVALYRGNGSPEDTCGRPLATGCDWTNEKKLLSAVLSGNLEGFRQAPVVATTLEQASVLSSDDEKDYNTPVYRETMVATENNTSRSSLGKRKAIEGDRLNPLLTVSNKKRCPTPGKRNHPDTIPSNTNADIQPNQMEKRPPHGKTLTSVMERNLEGNRADRRVRASNLSLTKPGKDRNRGRTGMASILASVLDSDDEGGEVDEFPAFVKPECDRVASEGGEGGPVVEVKKGAACVEGKKKLGKAGIEKESNAGAEGTDGRGVGQSCKPQREVGECGHGENVQESDPRRDHHSTAFEKNKMLREGSRFKKQTRHRVEESAREEPGACAMDVDVNEEMEDRVVGESVITNMQKSEKQPHAEERNTMHGLNRHGRLLEQNRTELTGGRSEKESVRMMLTHRKKSEVRDRSEDGGGGGGGEAGVVFESLFAWHRIRVSGKISGDGSKEGVSVGGVNFKTFVKVWPMASRESAPCFRGTIYKESGFDSSVFDREQQEKEKDAKVAEELFADQVSRRVGLTGRSRVKKGRRIS